MTSGSIKYYSTNLKAPEASFRQALLNGLAPDGGLYMPGNIPPVNRDLAESFAALEYHEIAAAVLGHLLGNEIDDPSLKRICREAYTFPVPLEKVSDNNYILRLDNGPTASFKDFAARMMARLMHYYRSAEDTRTTILTATSGDTGGAVADAFHGLENFEVVILFPADEVTSLQRKQMTTLNNNIRAIAVNGKFDDCQQLVKKAFMDDSLRHITLSSANSINIGRLLPQTVYYFYAWSRLTAGDDRDVFFSVPAGNFGNLMGGVLAREMGLPIKRFIIATNSNNEVPRYLSTGIYEPVRPSYNCISSAMNVGHPSNLARLVALYGGSMTETGKIIREPDLGRMRNDFFGVSVDDEQTKAAIIDCHRKYGVLLEPHGAVAWKGIELFHKMNASTENQAFVALETAHPAKFSDEIVSLLGFTPSLPSSLEALNKKEEEYITLENNYKMLRDLILKL